MIMAISSNHHYIPIFYLNRFATDQKEIAIFDKVRKKLKKGYYSTSSHFFDKSRNIIKIKNECNDDLEKIYQKFDSKVAEFFNSIEGKSESQVILSPFNILHIKMFMAVMFWRIPESDSLVDKYFNTLSFNDLGLKIIDENGNHVSIQIKNELINKRYFRQIYRTLQLPLKTFSIFFKDSELYNWHYYYTETEHPRLCCDNPILYKNMLKFFNFEDDIIFPLTKDFTIIFTRKNHVKTLPPKFNLDFDLALFAQAKKYVCSSDREYLNAIANLYYRHYQDIAPDQIKAELFAQISKIN
jgi:hypothetical protein